MTQILTKQYKPFCKEISWINVFLMSCTVFGAGFALAQTPTPVVARQDQLFKEAYRLAVPQNVLVYPWMSSIVDYDNDGALDILLYGHHSGDAFIWRSATSAAEYLVKGSWVFGVRDPIWLDVDKDGDIDGVGTEGTNISGKLFINQGNGNFMPSSQSFWIPSNDLKDIAKFLLMPSHIPLAKHPLDAKLTKAYYVDLNNDGKPELVPSVTGQITFQTATGAVTKNSGYSWVLEQKNGIWTDVTESLGLRNGLEQQFLPEDIDMDGDLDLIDLFTESLYRNDGYVFTKANTSPIFGGRRPYDGDGEIDVIDLDNNGYRDLIFGGDHTTASGTYLNTGNFSFQRLEGTLIRTSRRERKFADLDNDGDIDVVAYNGKEMIVYHNVTPNAGIHVTFAGDYFGSQLQVKDGSGKLVFNAQLFQHQTKGMSQVYTNAIHVGGITGSVQAFVNDQAAARNSQVMTDSKNASFINGVLHIPKVEVDGIVYAVKMQFTDPVTQTFSLKEANYVSSVDQDQDPESTNAIYVNGILTLPLVLTAGDRRYEATLNLVDAQTPMRFVLVNATEVP